MTKRKLSAVRPSELTTNLMLALMISLSADLKQR